MAARKKANAAAKMFIVMKRTCLFGYYDHKPKFVFENRADARAFCVDRNKRTRVAHYYVVPVQRGLVPRKSQ